MLIKIITRRMDLENEQYCQDKLLDSFKQALKSAGHEIVKVIMQDHTDTHGLNFNKGENKTKPSNRGANWDNYFTDKQKQRKNKLEEQLA